MPTDNDMDWFCRRHQLAEHFMLPVERIARLQPQSEAELSALASSCHSDIASLKAQLHAPLAPRWQLVERRTPLPARSLRCALASHDGELIDGHFSRCSWMYLFDVSASGYELVSLRQMPDEPGGEGHQMRVNSLNDCQLLFVAAIGGPAAARVIRADIYPMKVRGETYVDETLANLQQRLDGGQLPPWLKKIMGESWQGQTWSSTTSC